MPGFIDIGHTPLPSIMPPSKQKRASSFLVISYMPHRFFSPSSTTNMSRRVLRSHSKNNSLSLEDPPFQKKGVVKMNSTTGKKKAPKGRATTNRNAVPLKKEAATAPLKQQKLKAAPMPKNGKVAPQKKVARSEKATSTKATKMVVSKKPIAAPPVVSKKPIAAPPVVSKKPIAALPIVSKKPIAAPPLISKKPIAAPPLISKKPIASPPKKANPPQAPTVTLSPPRKSLGKVKFAPTGSNMGSVDTMKSRQKAHLLELELAAGDWSYDLESIVQEEEKKKANDRPSFGSDKKSNHSSIGSGTKKKEINCTSIGSDKKNYRTSIDSDLSEFQAETQDNDFFDAEAMDIELQKYRTSVDSNLSEFQRETQDKDFFDEEAYDNANNY
jgi:hypothetical protein